MAPPPQIYLSPQNEPSVWQAEAPLGKDEAANKANTKHPSRPFRIMKLSTSLLLPILATAYAMEDRGCVETVQPGQDLFPVKVEPKHSAFWDVEYFNTYKIAKNTAHGLNYLLYQCGTEIPADVDVSKFNATVEIPLTDVAISQTPMISYMEQLGLRDEISAFLSPSSFVSSPCFAQAIASGEVSSLDRGDNDRNPSFVGSNPPQQSSLTSFVAPYEGSSPPPLANNLIAVSEYEERTNNAIFEWVKFFALFFNKEQLANQVFETAEARFECIANNAGAAVADTGVKPKLLWGYYSDYCQGWDVAECPNYYCEFAEACSADLMTSSEGSNEVAMEICGAKYMTDEEFFAFAKDADYWFFPAPNWEATLAVYNQSMTGIKAYRDERVYDYMGRGDGAWFEQRFAEYYKVVEDMCHTLGVKQSLVGRHFWRNVFTEDVPASGVDATCDGDTAANILADPDTCVPVDAKTGSAAVSSRLVVTFASLLVAFLRF